MKKDKAIQLIRECLNEVTKSKYTKESPFRSFGRFVVNTMIKEKIPIKKWDVIEYDKNVIMLRLSFKLLRKPTIQSIFRIINNFNGEMRMYPDNDFIGMDIIIKTTQ